MTMLFRRLACTLFLWLAVMVGFALAPPVGLAAEQGAVTTFIRDPALLEAKEAELVAALRRQSPQAAAELETFFAQDLIGLVGPELQRMGLNDEDMADMTAAYWIVAWEAAHGIVGAQADPAIIKGVREQIAQILLADPATARMSDRDKQEIADTMLLQALFAQMRMDAAAKSGAALRKQMSDTIHAEASQILKADLRKMTLTAAGIAPGAGASNDSADTPPPAATASTATAAALHPENWEKVEGVYFRAYTTFGVGGMVVSDFEPLVFFRDGTYYEVEGPAIEEVDLAASRRASPRNWGRWSKSGSGFALINAEGKSSHEELQDGSFFKAFPAEAAGNRLAVPYKRVSGGGNSALGGEMTIAARNNLIFSVDGRYTHSSSAGAIGSGDTTGVATSAYSRRSGGEVGRYEIERYTISLAEPDGTVRRQFFAFGSRKNPPQPDPEMIFIGDRVFIADD